MARRFALIVGNSSYEDAALSKLVAPDVDVRALAAVLRDQDIGEFDDVIELLNQPASLVRREVARFFIDRKRNDLLVLYFSGHGVRDDHGHLYLALKDTERGLLTGTALEASFITEQMDRCHSKRLVLMLDCCHSGAFDHGTKGVIGASVGTAAAFEGNGFGRVVLTATDSTQYAWEGDSIIGGAENSLFTHFLIQGLKTGDADRNQDGVITIDELYGYVYEKVITETPKQTPGRSNYKQQGDIVIAQNRRPVVPPVVIPGPPIDSGQQDPLASVWKGWTRAPLTWLAALAVIVAALVLLASVVWNGPPPVDPDADAREHILRAQMLYDLHYVTDAISYLERQPPHQLIAATINDWRSKLSAADRDRHAAETVDAARKLFAAGGRRSAIGQLNAFQPPHPAVTAAIAELESQVEALARTAVADAQKLRASGRVNEAIAMLEAFQPDHALVSETLNGLRAQVASDNALDRRVNAARGLLRKGRFAEALTETRAGLQAEGAEPRLLTLLDEIQASAERQVGPARQAAEAVAGARERSAFTQATTSFEAGGQARRAGRAEDAIREYGRAVVLYDQARAEALKADASRGPEARRAIGSVLLQFQAAYNAKTIDGLRAVYQMPEDIEQAYRKLFGQMRKVEWTYQSMNIETQGDDATAVCLVTVAYVSDRGQPPTTTQTRRFTLRRSGGGWKIVKLDIVK